MKELGAPYYCVYPTCVHAAREALGQPHLLVVIPTHLACTTHTHTHTQHTTRTHTTPTSTPTTTPQHHHHCFWPNRSMSILPPTCKAPGQPNRPVDIPTHHDLQSTAGRGLLGARFAQAGSRGDKGAFSLPPLAWFILSLVVVVCLALASIAHWGWPGQRRFCACPRCLTLVRPVPPRGQARWIRRRRWKVPWRRGLSQRRKWKFTFEIGKHWRGTERGTILIGIMIKTLYIYIYMHELLHGGPTQSSDDAAGMGGAKADKR